MAPAPRSIWRRYGWLLRWGGTLLAVGYLARLINPGDLARAFRQASLAPLALAIAALALNVSVGAWRWRVLLAAYGAARVPAWGRANRLYFIAFFYNTCLPGAVVGDVMRGVVTRDSFGPRGTTGAIAVVLVERALGLFAVFGLLAVGLFITGATLSESRTLWWWSLGGLGAALAAVAMLPFARRFASILPGPLATLAAQLPQLTSPPRFALATLLSVATQGLTALAGWLIMRDVLGPVVGISQALLVVPLAAATSFLPITVGGAGAREAVFVSLCTRLFGASSATGLAISLLFWMTSLAVGLAGGLLQLLRPLVPPPPT